MLERVWRLGTKRIVYSSAERLFDHFDMLIHVALLRGGRPPKHKLADEGERVVGPGGKGRAQPLGERALDMLLVAPRVLGRRPLHRKRQASS